MAEALAQLLQTVGVLPAAPTSPEPPELAQTRRKASRKTHQTQQTQLQALLDSSFGEDSPAIGAAAEGTGKRLWWVDDCTSFNCGQGCKGAQLIPQKRSDSRPEGPEEISLDMTIASGYECHDETCDSGK